MNKRGMFLAEQVVKIVIALISLTFLIYLLTSLYFNKLSLENQEKAQDFVFGSHDSLKSFITNNLSQGHIELFNPSVPNGWYLFNFTRGEKPVSCEKKKCLCVCDNVWDVWNRQIKECNDKGACLIVENLKDKLLEIELRITTTLIIIKSNNEIVVSEKNEVR